MKRFLFVILAAGFVFGSTKANASPACPTEAIRPFVGTWEGSALLLPAHAAQQQSGTKAEFVIQDCHSFRATFRYLDSAGVVVRTVEFQANASAEEVGLFTIATGSVTDSSGVTSMTGSFKQIQLGTLLGTFIGSIGGQPAYMTELMNITEPTDGPGQLVRTVQMFAGQKGGAYLASRVVTDHRSMVK